METEDSEKNKTDENKLAIISIADSKSIIIPTIPIFQIRQTSSQAISSLTESFSQYSTNHLNIDIANSDSNIFNENKINNNSEIDWSNSLFRPATGFKSKRRECKSFSEENFVNELKTSDNVNNGEINSKMQSFSISPNCSNKKFPVKLEQRSANFHATPNLRQINGQFGFNPVNTYNRKLAQLVGTKSSNDLKSNLGFKFLSKNKDKKGPKRLGDNKFQFEYSNQKHQLDSNYNKKLFHLVSNNEYIKLKDLLDLNMHDVNCCDDKQRTCLHIASSRGNLEIVRLLLDYGANPNIRDCVCNLPIHLAIISSHVSIVTLLLEAGTDIQSLDLNGKTVLHLAGTRLRWLLNSENDKASPKLKFEAIMIMNMIKEYLRRKKVSPTDLDLLTNRLESVINLDGMDTLDDVLNQFDTLNIKTNPQNTCDILKF